MSEENKKMENPTNEKEETKAKKPDVDADVTEDENGNMKAVPKKTVGEKVKGGLIWVGQKAKAAVPYVVEAVLVAGATVGVLGYLGNKDENKVDVSNQGSIEDKQNNAE